MTDHPMTWIETYYCDWINAHHIVSIYIAGLFDADKPIETDDEGHPIPHRFQIKARMNDGTIEPISEEFPDEPLAEHDMLERIKAMTNGDDGEFVRRIYCEIGKARPYSLPAKLTPRTKR